MYFFIYRTNFMKTGPDSQIWQVQIWNDRSQKQKKNYGRHPLPTTLCGKWKAGVKKASDRINSYV